MLTGRECGRCLLADMPESEYVAYIRDYVASLDSAVRAPVGEYERRLALCRACANLLNGVCRLCGCFVEARAAKAAAVCPASPPTWGAASPI